MTLHLRRASNKFIAFLNRKTLFHFHATQPEQ